MEVMREADQPLNTQQKDTLKTLLLLNGKEDNLLKCIGECMLNIVEVMLIVSAR